MAVLLPPILLDACDMTKVSIGRLSSLCCGLLILLAFSIPVFAVYPEDGMYWDPNDAGRGFYFEVQDETVFIVIFAYAEDTGEAEIYTAAAPIRDDAVYAGRSIIPSPLPDYGEGYFPLHWVEAHLYKVENGPCLFCMFTGAPFTTEVIGKIYAWFPWTGAISVEIETEDGTNGIEMYLQRQDFARAPMIRGDLGRVEMPDMGGLWGFTDLDHSDPKSWRFEFDERIPDTVNNETPFEVIFRDSGSGAEWRCALLNPVDEIKLNGCELHLDGEILFAANSADLGVKKITAFRGPLPAMVSPPPGSQHEFFRGPDLVVGVRIDAPEPVAEMQD